MEQRSVVDLAGPLTTVMASVHPSLRGKSGEPRPEDLDGIEISANSTRADAAARFLRTGSWMLVVVDDRHTPIGMVLRDQLGLERTSRRRGRRRRTV